MIVFIDIDHTVSDAAWRDAMIGGEGGWDAYHLAAVRDKPIEPMANIVRALHLASHTVVASTARPEKWRQLTMAWLIQHDVPFDLLLMRGDKDFRPSPLIKLDHSKEGGQPDIVIDDRDDVCKAWAAKGAQVVMMTFSTATLREEV